MEYELSRLLDAAKTRRTALLPLVVGFCGYVQSDFKSYQAFNDPDRPLEELPRRAEPGTQCARRANAPSVKTAARGGPVITAQLASLGHQRGWQLKCSLIA